MTLGTTPTVPIAANDREAKETIATVIANIGLDPWDAGPLRFSRSIESFGLLFWVPLQQGRKEGIEMKFIRSSYWPCVWDVPKEFGPTADQGNLAKFPEGQPPRPCDSYKSR